MKLAYPIATSESSVEVKAFIGSFQKNVEQISKAGYQAVELLVRDPEKLNKKEIKEVLTKYNLEVAAVGTSPMQIQDQLFLLHSDQSVREEAYKRCLDVLKFAAYFHTPMVIGKYRGNTSGHEGCRESDFVEILKEVSSKAKTHEIKVLIEPQKTDNINFLNTVTESVEWITQHEIDNVELLIDTYHMGFTEDSITESIEYFKEYIGFVHLADHDRRVPGTGNLNMSSILNTLKNIGYKNYLSIEIEQLPNSEMACQLTSNVLNYLDEWNKV